VLLSVRGVSVRFGGIVALDGVSFELFGDVLSSESE
jgi:ABC-type branched-subunit amino acid transport system ATPase component